MPVRIGFCSFAIPYLMSMFGDSFALSSAHDAKTICTETFNEEMKRNYGKL